MDILAVVKIPTVTGLPEDTVQTTWHFTKAGDIDAAGLDSIEAALEGLFTGAGYAGGENGPVQFNLGHYFSQSLSRAADACSITLYDETTQPIGAPLRAPETFTLTAANAGTSPLPSEVAAVLSFRADITGVPERIPIDPPGPANDDRPRARRRGRVYLGPLNSGAASLVGNVLRPTTAFRRDVLGQVEGFLTSTIPGLLGAGIDWAVHSETENISRPVRLAWMDDAFDTQRRRGEKATSRMTQTISV